MRLVTDILNSGNVIVRPEHGLGTCGWYPKAWMACYVKKHETPIQAFLLGNPNWTKEEIDA